MARPKATTVPKKRAPRKTRAIAEESTSKVTPEMTKLAAEYYRENKKMNTAKSASEKARKLLYTQMKEAGLKSFDFDTNLDGTDLILSALISARAGSVIDVDYLYKNLPIDDFLKAVGASKKAVVDVAGTDMATRASRATEGTPNVGVKPKA